MKLKKNGIVPISLRQKDVDLRNIVEQLPDGEASHVIRCLLKDGLTYQKMVRHGGTPYPTELTAMMSFMDLDFLVEDIPVQKNVKSVTTPTQVEDRPQQEEIVEEIQVAPEPEEIEDVGDFSISDDDFL